MPNAQSLPLQNEVRNGFALLSPDLFLSLDRLARRVATRPIRICSELHDENDRPLWGALNYFSSPVCLALERLTDDTAEQYREISVIDLVTRIRLSVFRTARRPEIDLGLIPDERIFEYVVMHEVGHAVDNFRLDLRGSYDAATRKAAYICNEVLADRYAWKAMFPGVHVPTASQRTCTAGQLCGWMKLLHKAGVKRRPSLNQTKPSDDPQTFVPSDNFKQSVIWPVEAVSNEGRAYVAALRHARIDKLNGERRWRRSHARRMVMAWSEFAQKPCARDWEDLKRGNLPSRMLVQEARP